MNWDTLLHNINENISFVLSGSRNFFPALYQNAGLHNGKRLRAKLFFLFAQNTSQKSIQIATSIELLHAATLIHDDILDNSKLRRGNPTLHTNYGIPSSLLYGDYLFSTAFLLVAKLNDAQIYHQISHCLNEVLMGEMIENDKRKDITLNKKEYLSIIEKKSGALFGLACRLGSMTKKATKQIVEKSYQFGISAGIAYQIIDDYLDYFGPESDKETGKDLQEGVITLPMIYLLETCSEEEKQLITAALTNGKPKSGTIKKIITLMKTYQIPDRVVKDLNDYLKKAKTRLPKQINQKLKDKYDILKWLGDKINHD